MIGRLLRAVVIGAATVFAAKLPHQHWSTAPTVTVAEERAEAGDPSDPDRAPN